jgi:hypothetical protein
VEDVPVTMIKDKANIGLYLAEAPDGDYVEHLVIGKKKQTIIFKAPQPGQYEIRAYSNNSVFSPWTLVSRQPITVEEPGAKL